MLKDSCYNNFEEIEQICLNNVKEWLYDKR